jgi:hypothetical protein
MCFRVMVIKFKNTLFKTIDIKLTCYKKYQFDTHQMKLIVTSNITIYDLNNVSKDNVNPCEMLIYYIIITTPMNSFECVIKKMHTFTIHDEMIKPFD